MSNATTNARPGTVASEAIRIRPLLEKLEESNKELLLDIVDNLTDDVLAERYTSGDKLLLQRRIRTVLTRLGIPKSITVSETREMLRDAFED